MIKKIKGIMLCLFSLSLCSCSAIQTESSYSTEQTRSSYLPEAFTAKNIMSIHSGMTSGQISKLFGDPKNVRQNVCGEGKRTWICTTWEYGKFPYDRASFTFSGNHGSLILNNFEIKKD